jgi:hypothetical protein
MNWLRSTIGMIVTGLGLLLIVVAFLYLQSCSQNRQQAAQGKVDRGQSGASIQSGTDAMNTMGNVVAGDAATDATVKGGIDEVRAAAEGQRGLAAQRAACRLRAYAGTERCARLRAADPGNVARPGPARPAT